MKSKGSFDVIASQFNHPSSINNYGTFIFLADNELGLKKCIIFAVERIEDKKGFAVSKKVSSRFSNSYIPLLAVDTEILSGGLPPRLYGDEKSSPFFSSFF